MKRVFLSVAGLLLLLVLQGSGFGQAGRGFLAYPALQPTPQPDVEPTSNLAITWESLQGPYERLIYGLLVDVDDPKTLYAGTWGAGLYRSTDAGATWQAASLPAPDCPEPACDPRLFQIRALAQSAGGGLYLSRWGGGIYRSADQGRTWEFIASPLNGIFPQDPERDPLLVEQFLIITPTGNDETIYAATHDGVYFSIDGGDRWQQAVEGIPEENDSRQIQALATDGNTLYAGSFGGGVFASKDWGQSWQSIGPSSGPESKVFAVLPTEEGVLIGTAGAGVLWSSDSGQTWQSRNEGLPDNPLARRVQVLIADKQGVIYAGTVDYGVYRSDDGGQTWQPGSAGLTGHALSIVHLSADPAGKTIYAGTYGEGVYHSADGAKNWLPLGRGLPGTLAFEVKSLAIGGQDLLAGTFLGGMYALNLAKEPFEWRRLPKGLPVGGARNIADIVVSDRGEAGQSITLAAGTGIFRSVDGGASWSRVNNGLPEEDLYVAGLAQGRRDPRIIYAVLQDADEGGLYRSLDGGQNWSRMPVRLSFSPAAVRDLVVGPDDETLYLGTTSQGVYVIQGDQEPEPLEQAGPRQVLQLVFESRSFWQRALLGGQPRTLCALAWDGIYCSYDDGDSWKVSAADRFSALLMAPAQPGRIYAVSPETVQRDVSVEVTDQPVAGLTAEITGTQTITRPLTLWISLDAGRSWGQADADFKDSASQSGLNLTVLAPDPADPNVIYAGAARQGVFRGQLRLPSVWQSPRAVMGITFVVIIPLFVILLGLAFIGYTWWSLSLPYGVPFGQALALATTRRRRLQLVLGPALTLSPLQRLILAAAPGQRFQQEEIQQRLGDVQAHASFSQMADALHEMGEKLGLLSREGPEFRLTAPGLERIAHARFWPEEIRNLLAKRVREENGLYRDARAFFEAAGFLVHSTFSQFILLSDQPRYAIYEGLYARLISQPQITPDDIDKVRDEAATFYNAQIQGRLAFLVMALPPPVVTLRHITRLREEEGLTLILLTHSAIRQALAENTAGSRLEFSLHRSTGRRDLFQLDNPAIDDLDFFGRQADLDRLVNWVRQGEVVLLQGMPRVGKTSLTWQVGARLADVPVGYLHLNHPDVDHLGLYGALLQTLLADLTRKLPHLEWPLERDQIGLVDRAQFQADLDRILGGLDSQAAQPFLALMVDGVVTERLERAGVLADWQALVEMAGQESQLGLLVVLDTVDDAGRVLPGGNAFRQQLSLLPFTPQESADLVSGVAAQMNLEFSREALQRLHQATGGHPQMLRQLSSLIVQWKDEQERLIGVDLVEETLEGYVTQPAPLLRFLWRSLSPASRQFLGQLALLEAEPPAEEAPAPIALGEGTLDRLAPVGWIREEDGSWRLFSQTLARWLVIQDLV